MRRLLIAAVVLVVAKDAVPYGLAAYQAQRLEERRQRFMALKDREIACLERLAAQGVPRGVAVEAAIDGCKALATDPATGRYATFP